MEDLIARLAKATGPDRNLDHEIASYVLPVYGFGRYGTRARWVAAAVADDWRSPHYTASLDAAKTLAGDRGFMIDCPTMPDMSGHQWVACVGRNQARRARGATPELALTIAALKARIQP